MGWRQHHFLISVTISINMMAVLRVVHVFHVLYACFQMALVANGIEVYVDVSPDVPTTMAPDIVQAIEDVMTAASTSLYRMTDGRLSFRQVVITIPSSWKQIDAEASVIRSSAAQVLVTNAPVIAVPRTVACAGTEGCGRKGDMVQLPMAYLISYMQKGGDSLELAGKRFAVQWVKYWYGVYDEDDIGVFYYDVLQGTYMPTLCSNQPIPGSLVTVQGQPCAMDEYGRPAEGCYFKMDATRGNATTSLLLQPLIEQMTDFCEDSNHNKYAPTLQNRLCNGRSAWTMMNLGEIPVPGEVSLNDPSFSVVRRSTALQIVIAIEASITSRSIRPFTGIFNSIVKMVANLDGQASFSLVDISEYNASIVMPWQQTGQKFITGLNDAYNFITIQNNVSTEKGIKCSLVCTVNAVLQVVAYTRPNPSEPMSILLLMDATNDDDLNENLSNAGRLQRALMANNTSLMALVYGGQPSKLLQSLAEASGGGVIVLPFDPMDPNIRIQDEELALDEALLAAVSNWDIGLQMVQHDMIEVDEPQQVVYMLHVDQDCAQGLTLMITSSPNTISVTDVSIDIPDGTEHTCQQIYKEANVLQCSVSLSVPDTIGSGELQLSVSVAATTTLIFQLMTVVDLTATNVQVSARLDSDSLKEVQPSVSPVRVTATVRRGAEVPSNVYVSVLMQYGSVATIETVQLKDDGKDPDLMPQDGILSGYLTRFEGNGNYAYKILATGTFGMDPEWTFVRQATTIYLTVDDGFLNNDSQDSIAPNAIVDFGMISYPQLLPDSDIMVRLRWTSPGDDLANGQATAYEMRSFITWEEAVSSWDYGATVSMPPENLPLAAGSEEMATVNISSASGTTLYLVLKARDEVDHWGPPSNVVIVNMPYGPRPYTTAEDNDTVTDPTDWTSPVWETESSLYYETHNPHHRASGVNGVITSFIFMLIAAFAGVGIAVYIAYQARRSQTLMGLSARQRGEVPYETFPVDL